jgi:uncharacterized protein (TIGR01732 family)
MSEVGYGMGHSVAFILVLFILLVIITAGFRMEFLNPAQRISSKKQRRRPYREIDANTGHFFRSITQDWLCVARGLLV